MQESLDVLAIGTHPDDLEITCGGTLVLLANCEYRVGAADLTAGELGTRGSAEIRAQETANASRVLKLCVRENLNIPDGNIENTLENRLRVIRLIRRYRPRLLMIPHWEERHYDHVRASLLLAEAAFQSGLPKIETGQACFRPFRTLYYQGRMGMRPSFVVDISATFDAKMQAILSYRSQFHNSAGSGALDDADEPQTMISTAYALEVIEANCRYYGAMIGARYGEPFLLKESLEISDPVAFFRQIPDTKQAHVFPAL
ncbi:MAG: bacillithiol biosynthesis deacetylase BshB1 [Acidobacteria bacterium]|nr:bacillithiol biosynthesis deacetylase BshB1 [Acidobacteriota bacterium]